MFSELEWEIDPERGLNGYCDFVLTHGPSQHFIAAPFAVLIEAKDERIPAGMGQCIAAMCAASVTEQKDGAAARPIFGAVTTGAVLKFPRLTGQDVTIDEREYYVGGLPLLLGVLEMITRPPAAQAAA